MDFELIKFLFENHKQPFYKPKNHSYLMDLTQAILNALQGIPPIAVIIFISMLPFIELRGSIPIAIFVYNMDWAEAFFLSVIGNMIPVPFILLFFKYVEKWLRRFSLFEKFFNWLYERTRKKSKSWVEKYGALGLIVFVAIPLPMTGAWTGSLISYLFDLKFTKAILWIFIGVVIVGIIVSAVCITGNSAIIGI